jgi:hypothetical protein
MSNAIGDVSPRAVNAPGSEPKKNVEKIDYAIGQSVLGTVLVARSRDGVCAIIVLFLLATPSPVIVPAIDTTSSWLAGRRGLTISRRHIECFALATPARVSGLAARNQARISSVLIR